MKAISDKYQIKNKTYATAPTPCDFPHLLRVVSTILVQSDCHIDQFEELLMTFKPEILDTYPYQSNMKKCVKK